MGNYFLDRQYEVLGIKKGKNSAWFKNENFGFEIFLEGHILRPNTTE